MKWKGPAGSTGPLSPPRRRGRLLFLACGRWPASYGLVVGHGTLSGVSPGLATQEAQKFAQLSSPPFGLESTTWDERRLTPISPPLVKGTDLLRSVVESRKRATVWPALFDADTVARVEASRARVRQRVLASEPRQPGHMTALPRRPVTLEKR